MASFGVVIDACVLIKASVRDTLIRVYAAGFYRLYWSESILAEVTGSLVSDGLATEAGARRLAGVFREVLADAEVFGFEHLTDGMTNDPKDRHVLAAAVYAGARYIVTENLKDYPNHALALHGVEARSADAFLTELFELDGERMADIVTIQASVLRNPPLTVDQVLDNLTRAGVPTFARLIRTQLGLSQAES